MKIMSRTGSLLSSSATVSILAIATYSRLLDVPLHDTNSQPIAFLLLLRNTARQTKCLTVGTRSPALSSITSHSSLVAGLQASISASALRRTMNIWDG